ncbi:MAG: isoleucine--tRNA ligase, partial [Bacteroidetes bacterium]|nr:isoleucine--tRNA ligase [Bacteroidota bacterium]
LTDFIAADKNLIDKGLEERMQLAQKISSMVLSLRKKTNIRVRQPLNKIMIPVLNKKFQKQVEAAEQLILSEVNVKAIEYLTDVSGILVKKVRPNFKTLGPKYGKMMKQIAASINQFNQDDISDIEANGRYLLNIGDEKIEIQLSDVEIITEDIPGWVVTNLDTLTVALDISMSPELREEGIARELINRIQNYRKDQKFEVTDRIKIELKKNSNIDKAINNNNSYICSETLAKSLTFVDNLNDTNLLVVELVENIQTYIRITKTI